MTKEKIVPDVPARLRALGELIREAGNRMLMPAFGAAASGPAMRSQSKTDGSLVTETDTACQRFIQRHLQSLAPDIPLLGEEMSETRQLAHMARSEYWCLDPLDGTGNFASGFPCFALSLALVRSGRPRLAAIHDPVRDETFLAAEGRGAWLNGTPIRANAATTLAEAIGFVDFKRLPARLAGRLAATPFCRSQRNMGSCALEWAWLAAGRGAFIVHGGEKIWDFAAGALIAAEAGCQMSDFDGLPLFPPPALSSPVLAAASSSLHAQLRNLIADNRG